MSRRVAYKDRIPTESTHWIGRIPPPWSSRERMLMQVIRDMDLEKQLRAERKTKALVLFAWSVFGFAVCAVVLGAVAALALSLLTSC